MNEKYRAHQHRTNYSVAMVLRCPPNIINVYIVTCSMIMYTMSSSTMTVQHKSELRESDYSKQSGKSHPIADFFNAISDDKSLTIFNTVALNAGKTGILISTLGITRKQFYSKMERFTKLGLLVRREGSYYLTSLGKIMYQLQGIFGLALNNYWKLRAIDSLQVPGGLPEFEVNKLIDSLLENEVLKNLILSKVN
jgi:hypothetical protein